MTPVESCPIMFQSDARSTFILRSIGEEARRLEEEVFDDAGSLPVGYREKRREGDSEGGEEEETTEWRE